MYVVLLLYVYGTAVPYIRTVQWQCGEEEEKKVELFVAEAKKRETPLTHADFTTSSPHIL